MQLFSRKNAEHILQTWLGKPVHCQDVTPLRGGMVNSVVRVCFDTEPYNAVLKISSQVQSDPFAREYRQLTYLREHSRLPVPTPYYLGILADDELHFSVLALELLDGVNYGEARLNHVDRFHIEQELAEALLELHSHTRATFGDIDAPGSSFWVEEFHPCVFQRFRNLEGRIDVVLYRMIEKILDRFDIIFESQSAPIPPKRDAR
jgi:aminoglycoside phosphotransferase (APT) family kinase protein